MPFPLAHPAAVLPLRRYCPKYLNLPALVVGSICPDAGYCLARFNVSDVSHRFWGSFVFCLPVGTLTLVALYGLILPATRRLPVGVLRRLPPLSFRPFGSPVVIVWSLLIGAWSHLAWDSFTHTGGWLTQRLPLLEVPVAHIAGRTVRVCHLLWYGCSFGGVAMVFIAYEKWRQKLAGRMLNAKVRTHWGGAVIVALAVVPIELIHHLVHGATGRYLVVVCTLILGAAIMLSSPTREGPPLEPLEQGARQEKRPAPIKRL